MSFMIRSAALGLALAGVAAVPLQALAQGVATQQASSATPSATSNQIVVRDAASGQLRAATAEEAQTLHSKPVASRGAPARTLARAHSSGAQGVRLTDEFMSYSVMVRQADGSVAEICFASREEAEAALRAAPVAKNATAPTE